MTPALRSWIRTPGALVRLGVAGLVVATLGMGPGRVAAQETGPSNATLYEVTEEMQLLGRSSRPQQDGRPVRRRATAALMGTLTSGTSLCPLVEGCAITAFAISNIDLDTGRGSVHGTFKIVVEDQQTDQNATDGPERVVVSGRLNGRIDLSLAFFGPDGLPNSGDERTPLGSMDGRWSAVGERGAGPGFADVRTQGTLQGVFRLPFPIGPTPEFPFGAAYLLDDLETVVPVLLSATSLGRPTVRLDVTFVEQL